MKNLTFLFILLFLINQGCDYNKRSVGIKKLTLKEARGTKYIMKNNNSEKLGLSFIEYYDSNGRLLKRLTYKDKKPVGEINYSYNEYGDLIGEKATHNSRFLFSIKYQYDILGRLQSKTTSYPDRKYPLGRKPDDVLEYEYNIDNKLIKVSDGSGSKIFIYEDTLLVRTEYKEREYFETIVFTQSDYVYDSDLKLSAIKFRSEDENTDYLFNKDGRMSELIHLDNLERFVYEYNANGDQIKTEHYNSQGIMDYIIKIECEYY